VVVATAAAGATTLNYTDLRVGQSLTNYYVVLVQADGDRIVTSPIWYTHAVITATTPATTELTLAVYPNPTAGAATLSYYLPTAATIRADVSDALGQPVAVVTSGERQAAGPHTLAVPALPAGLYLVRLVHDGVAAYRKLLAE
jgi:hypothetical protein